MLYGFCTITREVIKAGSRNGSENIRHTWSSKLCHPWIISFRNVREVVQSSRMWTSWRNGPRIIHPDRGYRQKEVTAKVPSWTNHPRCTILQIRNKLIQHLVTLFIGKHRNQWLPGILRLWYPPDNVHLEPFICQGDIRTLHKYWVPMFVYKCRPHLSFNNGQSVIHVLSPFSVHVCYIDVRIFLPQMCEHWRTVRNRCV